jgi:L-ascorbate metabolism protein UlaG (beta-lactamase superfamily)
MRNLLTIIFFAFSFTGAWSQPDIIQTDAGNVTMTPILHAAVVLEWNGQTIYLDPYGGAQRFANFSNADLICITHLHGDHLNKETLQDLNLKNTTLVAPQSVIDDLGDLKFKEIKMLANGEKMKFNAIEVEAVPMYNLPDDETSRHRKGWGNGYVITMGGERFYFSGDTEDIPEMRDLKNIDYAFVCMNLPYTMDIDQAADAVLAFKPKVMYPYHFRGQNGFSDVEKFKTMVNAKNKDIEVRLRDWYPE